MFAPDELDTGRGWASASLRIATDELTCDAVTELIGLYPTSTRSAEGEPAFAVWMLESDLEASSSIEDHLYILMERLRDHRGAISSLAERATVEVWLSYSPDASATRTSVLDHQVLSELGALGIDVVLDQYPVTKRRPTTPASSEPH